MFKHLVPQVDDGDDSTHPLNATMWKDVLFESTKWSYNCPLELIAKYRRASGKAIRPPGFKGPMPPLHTVLEAEEEENESNRMQDEEGEEGEENKTKWKKGKKSKPLASTEENPRVGMRTLRKE
eukprot:1663206-Karenia_brevis.AAC.1